MPASRVQGGNTLNLVSHLDLLFLVLKHHVLVRVIEKIGASLQATVTPIDIGNPANGISELVNGQAHTDHGFMELSRGSCGGAHGTPLILRRCSGTC